MAALAYLLLPITGLAAYVLSSDARVRFHGLQAIALGLLWATALYAGSAVSTTATRIVFAIGALAWLALMVSTAAGRDPRIPLAGRTLEAAAAVDLRDDDA